MDEFVREPIDHEQCEVDAPGQRFDDAAATFPRRALCQ
jgi:hypothetical protein